METKPKTNCSLTPHIEKNVREQIRRLRKDGIVAMGMRNLFQVTPSPPQHLAKDETNLINYRPTFERVAAEVAAELNFPILAKKGEADNAGIARNNCDLEKHAKLRPYPFDLH